MPFTSSATMPSLNWRRSTPVSVAWLPTASFTDTTPLSATMVAPARAVVYASVSTPAVPVTLLSPATACSTWALPLNATLAIFSAPEPDRVPPAGAT
ncbi:hypothetical protein ASD92_26500 [Massilia sp. Root1485]|nr:hypothetical protein ASD92_26500 [Massilia sp. Root1485]